MGKLTLLKKVNKSPKILEKFDGNSRNSI